MSTPIPLTTYNQLTALAINSSGDIAGSYYNYAQGGFPSTTQYCVFCRTPVGLSFSAIWARRILMHAALTTAA